jgi:uncharacterized iron-regulated membrane protein
MRAATGEASVERRDPTRKAGETPMHWLSSLHSGVAFGKPGRVAMCLAGLTPLLLVSAGLWVGCASAAAGGSERSAASGGQAPVRSPRRMDRRLRGDDTRGAQRGHCAATPKATIARQGIVFRHTA